MNDSELDRLLDTWTAPAVPTSLREGVRSGFAARVPKGVAAHAWWRRAFRSVPIRGKGLLAGVALGGVLSLLIAVTAFPRSLNLWMPVPIPFTVDWEEIHYPDNGSSPEVSYFTAFKHQGKELTLSSSYPNRPFRTINGLISNKIGFLVYGIIWRRNEDRGATAWAEFIRNGCKWNRMSGSRVVGTESILGYATTVVRSPSPNGLNTEWLAPDLDCFLLRSKVEIKQLDGTFRVRSERRPLTVTVSP